MPLTVTLKWPLIQAGLFFKNIDNKCLVLFFCKIKPILLTFTKTTLTLTSDTSSHRPVAAASAAALFCRCPGEDGEVDDAVLVLKRWCPGGSLPPVLPAQRGVAKVGQVTGDRCTLVVKTDLNSVRGLDADTCLSVGRPPRLKLRLFLLLWDCRGKYRQNMLLFDAKM